VHRARNTFGLRRGRPAPPRLLGWTGPLSGLWSSLLTGPRSFLWVSERRTVTGAVLLESRLEHVLSLLDPRSSLALRIRGRLAGEADYRRGGQEAILAEPAAARAAVDPELLAEALSMTHHCLLGPDDEGWINLRWFSTRAVGQACLVRGWRVDGAS
jgi:hypothetical protein